MLFYFFTIVSKLKMGRIIIIFYIMLFCSIIKHMQIDRK